MIEVMCYIFYFLYLLLIKKKYFYKNIKKYFQYFIIHYFDLLKIFVKNIYKYIKNLYKKIKSI